MVNLPTSSFMPTFVLWPNYFFPSVAFCSIETVELWFVSFVNTVLRYLSLALLGSSYSIFDYSKICCISSDPVWTAKFKKWQSLQNPKSLIIPLFFNNYFIMFSLLGKHSQCLLHTDTALHGNMFKGSTPTSETMRLFSHSCLKQNFLWVFDVLHCF